MGASRDAAIEVERSPSHAGTVPLAGGWRALRCVFLRSTGFPIERVLALADGEVAALADALLDAERFCLERQREALAACRRDDLRTLARRLERRLASGVQLAPDDLPEMPQLSELRAALAERDAAGRAFAARALACERRDAELMAEAAADPLLREAISWQNRPALHTTVDAIARGECIGGGWRQRQRLLVLWSYLQRYATKNDTIGFFGPVGWAHLADHGPPVAMRAGCQLIARRSVYLEHWAVAAVAAVLGRDRGLRAETAPRLATGLRVEGERVLGMPGELLELPPPAAALLHRCDGRTSARAIAEALASSQDEIEQIYDLLDEMAEAGLIVWRLDVALGHARHEEGLRRELAAMPESVARARALRTLDELEAARQRVAAAAGDPAALDRALAELDEIFVRITGREPTRHGGRTYGGRTLVTHECVRDLDLAVGPALRERLAAPLALVLESARWLTDRIAAHYRPLFEQAFDELEAENGSVELLWLAEKVAPLLSQDQRRTSDEVRRLNGELRARWQRVLAPAPGERRVTRSSAELAAAVEAAFGGAQLGWPLARWQSPDILVAAGGPDALARGDFLLVLGELHLNSIGPAAALALREHPRPDELARTVVGEMREPRIAWLGGSAGALRTNHAQGPRVTHWAADEVELETADGRSTLARDRVFAVSDFVVERAGAAVRVRSRDGRRHFDLFELFSGPLGFQSVNAFGLLPEAPHTPRVTIDSLVVARETWRFVTGELGFARGKSAAERFLAARRWRRRHDLPRFLFARTPEELKPIYVDLESPIAVDLLAKLVRAGSRLTISEMLPDPDASWLIDGSGARYTCELRLAAIDPRPWRPPSSSPTR